MPSTSYVNPAISISTFSSWDEVYKWWIFLYQDKLKLDDEIKDFTKNLIRVASTDNDKAQKLYEFVAKIIRYVAIEYGDGGYETHYANEVLLN